MLGGAENKPCLRSSHHLKKGKRNHSDLELKPECKVASAPVCEGGDVPTRRPLVISFDMESVEKPTLALLQRSAGALFSCELSVI